MPVWTTKRVSFNGNQQTGVNKRPGWFFCLFVFLNCISKGMPSLFFPCQYYNVLLSMETCEKLPLCFVL